MRKLVLLSFWLLACRNGQMQPEFFDDPPRHVKALCKGIEALNRRGSQVSDVVAATDSTLLVLYGSERELVTYNSEFQSIATLAFAAAGPRGIAQPVSATTDGRLYYVADERQLAIKLFDAHGEDRGTVRLDFIPRRIRAVNGSVAITPLVAGSSTTTLLYELRHGRLSARAVPAVRYQDAGLNALANMSSLTTFADGRVLVIHETIVPFGYSLLLDGSASSPQRFAVPLPALQRPQMGRLPATPLTEKSLAEVLAVALTATSDPSARRAFILTRSGRKLDQLWEKMIVELDDSLRYVKARSLGAIRALHMAYFPARTALIVVDDSDRWFECTL